MNDAASTDTPGTPEPDDTGAASVEPTEAAPKRRARKTAAKAAAETAEAPPGEGDGSDAAAAPRKAAPRGRRKAAVADDAPAVSLPAEPVPQTPPAMMAVDVMPVAALPAHDAAGDAASGPRAAAAAPQASAEATERVLFTLAPEPAPQGAVEPLQAAAEGGDAGEGAGAEGGPSGPGRRRRDRNRDRDRPRASTVANNGEEGSDEGDAGPEGADAAAAEADAGPPLERVDVQARFADVLSGQLDAENPEEEAAAAVPAGRRVLRPEPEAPKLHKVLAQAGIGSRRDMEELILEGQVTVNGEPAHLGMRITQGDQIKVAGKPVKVRIAPPPARVLAYHKPVGEVVTHHDPEGRPTVFRRLPRLPHGKWLSVGRLDINTEGLLLFTNSGELSHQMMHPRFGIEREYAVRVLGLLGEEARASLLEGVDIDGQRAAFKSIEDGGGEGANHWYRVVIGEGRNREVRKLFDAVGLTVSRLIRIRYGAVVLPRGLKRGTWVELDDEDVRAVRRSVGMDRGDRPGGHAQGPQGGPGQGQGHGQGQGQGQGFGQGKKNRNKQRRGGGNVNNGPYPPQGGGGFRQGGPRNDPRDVREVRDARPPSGDEVEDDDIPLHIPNPLEQTFDRRFATGSKRISAGFGRPSDEQHRPAGGQGKGPKQPDPMQTSVGYIGADAYFRKAGGGKGRNRRGR